MAPTESGTHQCGASLSAGAQQACLEIAHLLIRSNIVNEHERALSGALHRLGAFDH